MMGPTLGPCNDRMNILGHHQMVIGRENAGAQAHAGERRGARVTCCLIQLRNPVVSITESPFLGLAAPKMRDRIRLLLVSGVLAHTVLDKARAQGKAAVSEQ